MPDEQKLWAQFYRTLLNEAREIRLALLRLKLAKLAVEEVDDEG